MDWNLIIGIILWYIGVGLAYTQWELDYYFKYREVREQNSFTVLCYIAFLPIFIIREKLDF